LAQAVVATDSGRSLDLKHPLNLSGREFADRKYEIYEWLREEAPVYKARIFSLLKIHLLSRYDDCMALLKDPRFVRNRTAATGGGRMPFPLPRSVALLARSMIVEDEPAHQRQRGLVNTAFKPRAIARIQERIERLTHELLDGVEKQGRIDLMPAYCQPIPATVISELVGVSDEDMPVFGGLMNTFAQSGLSGWNVFRAFVVELPKATRFMRQLIARKRQDPQDDILTGLIQAEENGERLTENEIVSLVFLLIVAGFETTVHLITNGVIALLQHPDQLERLRSEPQHLESAVEEILRYRGPVHGTKMNYATEDVEWHGITIPKGSAVVPVLGAANHDPRAFDAPDRFDITRSPNRHLAFGHGPHFCLGAQLARMETRLALGTLLERCPNLRLTVKPEQLRLQKLPLWHRHQSLPVVLG
jgi:cytochrome P450